MAKDFKEMTNEELLHVIHVKNRTIARRQSFVSSQKYYNKLLINRLKKIRRQIDDVIEHPYSEGLFSTRRVKSEKNKLNGSEKK